MTDGQQETDVSQVRDILDEEFPDRVFSVEEGVVWVSGMNANCGTVARRMADTLVAYDISCGLVYDDDAARFGGVQFNWGGVEDLEDSNPLGDLALAAAQGGGSDGG